MKDEILQQLSMALFALNNVSVSGKGNLANLSGSIGIIEKVSQTLESANVTPAEQNKE